MFATVFWRFLVICNLVSIVLWCSFSFICVIKMWINSAYFCVFSHLWLVLSFWVLIIFLLTEEKRSQSSCSSLWMTFENFLFCFSILFSPKCSHFF
ncbi:hypothetical protein ES332_A07G034300v1 [Gossypium tomentosum]|uniref:Uncharacterized protein n=1 Tax=Gossypium tomentosum TaxID=34277 RepID=A0A5D2PRN0_GOSTO|nr:hypothetical protein ES332_A07G034300v1 [Gossypium tomentosum]